MLEFTAMIFSLFDKLLLLICVSYTYLGYYKHLQKGLVLYQKILWNHIMERFILKLKILKLNSFLVFRIINFK